MSAIKYEIDKQKQKECQEYFNKHLELLHKAEVTDVSVELVLDSIPTYQDMNDREYRHVEHRKFEWNGVYKGGKFKLVMEEV